MNDNPESNIEEMKHYNVVCAIIVNEGEILCMRRPMTGSSSTAGKWEFPGGKIEVGEMPEEALLRELHEEMDYDVKIVKPAASVDYQYPTFAITLRAYICTADTRTFNRKEHIDHLWLHPDELQKLDWVKADEELLSLIDPTLL